jgi:hypothetical protein
VRDVVFGDVWPNIDDGCLQCCEKTVDPGQQFETHSLGSKNNLNDWLLEEIQHCFEQLPNENP